MTDPGELTFDAETAALLASDPELARAVAEDPGLAKALAEDTPYEKFLWKEFLLTLDGLARQTPLRQLLIAEAWEANQPYQGWLSEHYVDDFRAGPGGLHGEISIADCERGSRARISRRVLEAMLGALDAARGDDGA